MESWKKTFAVIWSGQLASILSSEVVAYSIIFWMSLETGMRRETLRRERRETWLLTAGGAGCFAALIAACVTTLWPDFRLRITDFALPRPELPHFTLPHFALSEEDKWLVAMCVCIALVFLALLLADLVIRRRIASSRN